MNEKQDVRAMLREHWEAVRKYAQEVGRREQEQLFHMKVLGAIIIIESIAFMLYVISHG